MNSSRPFVPDFLKKIDCSLLLKNPSVWSARTHLVLFWGILFAALLAVFCVVVFKDARQDNNMEIISGFVALISAIGFVFWIIYLLRFNVFKRYGNWIKGDGIRTFILFFVNILMFVAIPFIPLCIEGMMANKQFSNAELINDVNEININTNRLEHDRLPKFWESDTLLAITPKYEISSNNKDTIWLNIRANDENFHPNTTYIYKENLTETLSQKDSVVKINDSVFITYECPRYDYVKTYTFNNTRKGEIMDRVDIYNKAIKNYQQPNRIELVKRMEFFKTKYQSNDTYYEKYVHTKDQDEAFDEIIKKTYSLQEINNIIDRIVSKKTETQNHYSSYLHFALWFALMATLLLFIFRHTTIKTFFLSILTGVVLAILSGLFLAFINSKETTVYFMILVYFLLFAAISFTIGNTKSRKLLQGISLNFFLLALPIMPIVFTGLYFGILDNRRSNHISIDNDIYIDKTPYYLTAEIIGIVLLIILIEPLFKKLYKAWYAAPEE
jgi:hypothetical protein